jgi:RNA polymerase primary sigma factor
MFTDELTIDISKCDIDRTDEEIYNEYKNLSNDSQDRSLNDIINRCLGNNNDEEYITTSFFDKEKKEEEKVTFDSTQQYFKDINNVYERNGNDYDIEYCSENRDKLIEMNLKTVVSIAKKYQGLGLSLNELISAGNLGLVIAYDKFDPSRSRLKDNILSSVSELDCEFSYEELLDVVKDHLSYGDIQKKFQDKFKVGHRYKRKEVEKWINHNISNAKFNSIATMWIRAYILIEIDNHSRIVKKPKSEIYKDRDKNGSYKKEQIVDIDAPVGNDTDTRLSDLLPLEDDTRSDLDTGEAYDIYKEALNKLLDGVKVRDRSIFLKKFGIGLPRPMLPKEIAEQEDLSIARVSQIFQSVIEQMQLNQAKYNINPDVLFEAVKKFH